MKKNYVLPCILCVLLLGNVAFAATEHEPNNTPSQANSLTLNGSISGAINPAADVDWFKVTTNADGLLSATITAKGDHPTYVALYDHDGITLFTQNYSYTTVTISQDGLSPGTYYIKVYCYFSTDTSNYTLSDALTPAPLTNDIEPNGLYTQADALTLNGSITGHVGFYYNHVRDTADWFKFTTNSDGLVKLNFAVQDNQAIYWQLYDGNGTTYLNGAYTYVNSSYNTDGLAAGTYYVKVFCYFNSGFGEYTLTDSLFKPAQANDIEPNNSKAQAETFALNSTVTGHVGYYYNVNRDTSDWYKLTTNADGEISLTLTPANNTATYVTIYDNNGTTVLNSNYTYTGFTLNTDGLGKGTYYLRVYCYYNSQFAPYTLTNNLTTYTNANDVEPNNGPYQAKTMPANGTVTGHYDFYYNGAYDPKDWWKINYTGSGALTVTSTLETQKLSGTIPPTYMNIYKDTNAAPIYSQYAYSGLTASLTGLAQGYYWVEIIPYYTGAGQFDGYNLSATFTQVNKATITLQSTTPGISCTNGSISYKCAKSHAPYTVQLYRYELVYGSPMSVKNTSAFTISNLPPGLYHATVFGDGATGNAFGKTTDTAVVPVPTNTSTTGIKKTQVTMKWDSLACIKYYSIQYRVNGTTPWTTVPTTSNKGSFVLKNLTASTTYNWQVASVDTGNKKTATSLYLAGPNFTTLSAREEQITSQGISVYPNPASNIITLAIDNLSGNGKILILNMQGQIVQQLSIGASQASLPIDISELSAGMYQIKLIDGNSSRTLPFEKQ
jgi:Secretion system C-terminal sorting domain/Fibronectin type III domain